VGQRRDPDQGVDGLVGAEQGDPTFLDRRQMLLAEIDDEDRDPCELMTWVYDRGVARSSGSIDSIVMIGSSPFRNGSSYGWK
jgi:hypothetical protein